MISHVREHRLRQNGMNQQQLADNVLVSRQTVVAIERGDYNPSVKLSLLLARALSTRVEELFELEEKDHA